MEIVTKIRKFPLPLLTPLGFMVLAGMLPITLLGLLVDFPLSGTSTLLLLFCAVFLVWILIERTILSRWASDFQFALEVPQSFFSGVEAALELQAESRSKLANGELQLRLEVPLGVVPVKEVLHVQFGRDALRWTREYRMTPNTRGEVEWRRVWFRIKRGWGLSFLQFALEFDPAYRSQVYPNHQVADDDASKPLQHLLPGETTIEVRKGEGREFDSLRKYSLGDDLRRIDWKRSATGKGLLVRVYRPETHQRVNVAIDCGRRMGNRVDGRLQLDFAVDAAACLFRTAARNDDECGLFCFNEAVVSTVACNKGKAQQLMLRKELTTLTASSLESDYQLLAEWANSSRRRSLMLLITSVSSPAGLESIKRALLPIRKRHLPLVFAVADEDLEDAVYQVANGLTDAYIVSAARQQQLAIQSRAEQLGRFGIDCIYCRAKELPTRLRLKYEELKASGRL